MKKYLLAINMLCCLTAAAQNNSIKELHFNHLFMEDGLPIGQVHGKLQDKEGYMWICCNSSLIRYDGYKPKKYNLPSNGSSRFVIKKIFEDERGELWVGTRFQGLYHYNRSSDSFTLYENDPKNSASISKGEIRNISDDQAGNIWIDLWNSDKKESIINCFNPKTHRFEHYGREEKSLYKTDYHLVTALLRDKMGNMWFGSDNGLYEYDRHTNGFISHFSTDDSSKQKTFKNLSISSLSSDVLWAVVYNKSNGSPELWHYNKASNAIRKYSLTTKEKYYSKSDTIFTLNEDAQGHVWLSSPGKFTMFDPVTELFTGYLLNKQSSEKYISTIYEVAMDSKGDLWCATSSGLGCFNTEKKTFVLHNDHITPFDIDDDHNIYNIYFDHFGTLWFTSGTAGVQWISRSRSRYTLYGNNPSGKHNFAGGKVNSIAETRDGTIWMATTKGLFHWLPGTDSFELIHSNTKLPGNGALTSVISDGRDRVWSGGMGSNPMYNGIFCYDPATKKTQTFRYDKDFVPGITFGQQGVQVLYMDHTSTLWVGTWGSGICKFNMASKEFTRYPYIINIVNTPNNNKLDDDAVTGIYEDKESTLWISTNLGSL
ncbi:MAG: two-component regulator propeller domain-containing protein, partial [Chitinophagaceae bacterium]